MPTPAGCHQSCDPSTSDAPTIYNHDLPRPMHDNDQPSNSSPPRALAPSWRDQTEAFLAGHPEPLLNSTPVKAAQELYQHFRHSGWSRDRATIAAAFDQHPDITESRSAAFKRCGCNAHIEIRRSKTHLEFNHPTETAEFRLTSDKCKDRWCLPCARTRNAIIRDNLLLQMHGKTNLTLITLTLEASSDPLAETLDRINSAFKTLRGRKIWKKAVVGGCATIETKIGQSGRSWHTHMHIIAEAKYLPQADLSTEWHAITGDSFIVDVRRVGSHAGATNYITKYLTKGSDHQIVNSPRHLAEAITAFQGRRLVSTFGTWRGLQLSERSDDEQAQTSSNSQWEEYGSFDEIAQRARDGDTEAQTVLRKIFPRPVRPAS